MGLHARQLKYDTRNGRIGLEDVVRVIECIDYDDKYKILREREREREREGKRLRVNFRRPRPSTPQDPHAISMRKHRIDVSILILHSNTNFHFSRPARSATKETPSA
ncbi:hypothetical protein ACMFMG_007157 [Clarireedia jacksonii]